MADEANKSKEEGSVTLLGGARKADTSMLVVNGVESYPDDVFNGLYAATTSGTSNAILEPSFKPGTLLALTSQNNILLQCVEAMEVNIDGTGHSIDLIDGAPESEAEKVRLESFFKNPYPGKSMVSIRRSIRRDREATGNGYMEVIRNAAGDITLLNHLEADYTRLVALDDPVMADRKVIRDGVEVTVKMRVRERRYVQVIGGKKVYFKEYGSTRDLNRDTGEWAKEGQRLPIAQRASEVKHFCGTREPKTAYGTPRWINNLPSVLGSRKAEEHNLEFFDSGGIPPVLIIVQGGALGDTVKETLQNHMSAKGNKHRAAVVEATSTSGSIESTGNVTVRVERFGAERTQDAMFQKYDAACEEHVRTSFRLPPLFVGKSQDFNFATAYTSYMVAEAQVFSPEREEFDNFMNELCRELGAKSYRYRSLPMTLTDVTNQLKALEMVDGKHVSGETMVKKLNEITGLGMEYEKQEQPVPPVAPAMAPGQVMVPPEPAAPTEKARPGVAKSDNLGYLNDLANRIADGLDPSGVSILSGEEQIEIRKEVAELSMEDSQTMASILASKSIDLYWADPEGLDELCKCAVHGQGA